MTQMSQINRLTAANKQLNKTSGLKFNNNDLESQFQKFAQNFKDGEEYFVTEDNKPKTSIGGKRAGHPARVRSALFSTVSDPTTYKKPSTAAGGARGRVNRSNASKLLSEINNELSKSKSNTRLTGC